MQPVVRKEDTDRLAEILGQENKGSMRPQAIESLIEASHKTLSRELPWRQGVYLFKSTSHLKEGGEAITGVTELKLMSKPHWQLRRDSRRSHDGTIVSMLSLEFSMNETDILEFAANVVSKDHQETGIGKLHTYGRILHTLQYKQQDCLRLGANFLPPNCNDSNPFFKIVRQFLGLEDGSYETADEMRYRRPDLVNDLLGQVGEPGMGGYSPAVRIPLPTLAEESIHSLGQARQDTKNAVALLKRFHFRELGKFDLLDLGTIVETTVEELRRLCACYCQTFVPKPAPHLPPHTPLMIFAPSQRLPERFMCVSAPAQVDEGAGILWMPEDLYHQHLCLNDNETVMVLHDPPLPPQTPP
jgi:arginine/ornithine N-succinyltransferase beta subunit